MTPTHSRPRLWLPVALLILVSLAGCGGGGVSTSAPSVPLQDREKVAAALPKGVTLESPIVPDKLYGASSKTVEDALSAMMAHVDDNVLRDGGMGLEIRFEGAGVEPTPTKSTKKGLAKKANYMVIRLASGKG